MAQHARDFGTICQACFRHWASERKYISKSSPNTQKGPPNFYLTQLIELLGLGSLYVFVLLPRKGPFALTPFLPSRKIR